MRCADRADQAHVVSKRKSINFALARRASAVQESMHTFTGKSCTIHHSNSLHSAIVRIDDASGERVAIDMSDLLDFIGGLVRDEKIAKLEQQTGREALLGEVKL